MKISYNWLQNYFEEKLPEPQVIADGIVFHSFEVEEIEKIGDDTVFEIKILPDRAHDCLCHFGIAKEISAIFDLKILPTQGVGKVGKTGEVEVLPTQGVGASGLEIEVKSDKCLRYMGRVVKDVKVGASPEWLSNALVSIGQKSINNIVDATNYVMFDIGNPIHAFDLDKLASSKIIVEPAKNDEKFVLLDGREVVLDESMLTIRDERDALVIAGVKGGKKAEIDNNTKNIMIEVANFEPVSTRKTAGKLGIFTDSAKRFENEIPPLLAPFAMDKITDLVLKIAGGEVYEVVDIYKNEEKVKKVSFSESYLERMLGIKIPKESICDILERFDYKYTNDGDIFEVEIPFLRLDLDGPHDMVEEIGRIYGYDKVTPVLPKIDFEIKENKTWVDMTLARDYLVSQGYREVMNYTFADKGDVEVMASASDKNFLRTNLSDGMKRSFELNKLNLPFLGDSEVKIFDIGKVFPKGVEVLNVCFINKKEIKEMSLEEFISQTGALPQENPRHGLGEEEEPSAVPFKMWSVYPFMYRDIAVWLPRGTDKENLKKIFTEEGTELLVKEPYLFDSFEKGDKTSFAYRLVFQSYERTLTDEEINSIMTKIYEKIIFFGWEIR